MDATRTRTDSAFTEQRLLSVKQYLLSWINRADTMGLFGGKCTSKARLDGKTAVVTGCNTGIGKETVLDFVKRGARVIMACRDLTKAEEAAEDIRKSTQGLEGVGEVVVTKLDLSSLSSVRECATHLLKREPQINLLINNAGVMACPKALTEDGHEMQLAVNHLGHFLLTCLLLPRIRNSTPARIVNVSSNAHWVGSFDFEDMKMERKYTPISAYGRSKLANILFTKVLAEKLKDTGVTTYVLHPGVVSTELGRHMETSWLYRIGYTKMFTKTPVQGAQTTIYCAVDENAGKDSGFYYSDCSKTRLWGKARNPELAQKLWEVSAQLVSLENLDPFTAPDEK